MAEREKYYIGLNGQIFEVSKELYETYYKGQRKEKYFTHNLKQELLFHAAPAAHLQQFLPAAAQILNLPQITV